MSTVNMFTVVVDAVAAVALGMGAVAHLNAGQKELGSLQLTLAGICAGFAAYVCVVGP